MANRRPPGPLPGALRGVDFPGPCIVGNGVIASGSLLLYPAFTPRGDSRSPVG